MTTKEMSKIIRKWYKTSGVVNGPLLPDGWFGGRAYENQYLIKEIKALEDLLVINLNQDTSLIFEKPKRAYIDNSELVIEGYEKATIKYVFLGEKEQIMAEHYNYGEVRLFPSVG